MADRRRLTGWGRTAPGLSEVVPADARGVAEALAAPSARGVIARGLGRSYGDAAQNSGGSVLAPETHPAEPELTADGRAVRVPAATSLHDLMRWLLPRRRFVTVTPGTRYVTVGGAIACDIHGKNHHADGSFGDHVRGFELVLASGESRWVDRESDPALFAATLGGMGLTGVITSAVLDVLEVQSGYLATHNEQIANLDQLMSRMLAADKEATYSVAWIDTLARGRSLGRSVLSLGEHARLDQLTDRQRRAPLPLPEAPRLAAPPWAPSGLVSMPTIRAFNEMWFRKAGLKQGDGIESVSAFFHPLDGVAGWNRLYGRRGFVQYQYVLPDGAEAEVIGSLEMISQSRQPAFLSVLKRFGPGNGAPLSFPMQGWTLALDLPVSPVLRPLFDRLDELVVNAGGRLYLAKDSRLDATTLARMYPDLSRFAAVRDRVDPDRVFTSDLSRRLDL